MAIWIEVESKGLRWFVSSDGDIKTPAHQHTYRRIRGGVEQTMTALFPERPLSPYVTKSGYLEVAAMKEGKRIKESVHRLVAIAFVPGYKDFLSVNHIDGVKTNNRPENLEWVSLARNTQHQWETGLVDLRGEKQPGSKLTSKQVVYIRRLLSQGISAHTLAIVAGVSQSTIAMIRDGKRWPEVTAGRAVVAG
jgi:hypothetical protein